MTSFRIPFFIPWIFPRRVWKMKSKTTVYLTFDDGPQLELTHWILDFLEKENILATFFCVGDNVQKYPDLYQKLIKSGHAVGNHTMNHEKGSKVDNEKYLSSIDKASKVIESSLFRPPYGRLPIWKTKQIRSRFNIIMWSWLSYDFDNTVAIEKVISSANSIKGGDILVFHDNIKSKDRLKILLPEVVQIVKNKGLYFDVLPAINY